MDPFRCDFPVLLSGVPYLNPMVFKIGPRINDQMLTLHLYIPWKVSYNEGYI